MRNGARSRVHSGRNPGATGRLRSGGARWRGQDQPWQGRSARGVAVAEPAPGRRPYANVVRMENIRMTYGSVVALRNIDFTVGANEIVGLIGDKGAGQATLVKIRSEERRGGNAGVRT